MAYNYLYCVECTKYIIGTLAAGLATNVVLNLALLPAYGLTGAAIATAAGTGINLLLVLAISQRFGMQFDKRGLILMGLPLTLALGTTTATVCLLIIFWLALKTEIIFSETERNGLEVSLQECTRRFRKAKAASQQAGTIPA